MRGSVYAVTHVVGMPTQSPPPMQSGAPCPPTSSYTYAHVTLTRDVTLDTDVHPAACGTEGQEDMSSDRVPPMHLPSEPSMHLPNGECLPAPHTLPPAYPPCMPATRPAAHGQWS